MQVRATGRGFFYWIRHPGEIFEVAEHLFSKEWMEKVEPEVSVIEKAIEPEHQEQQT